MRRRTATTLSCCLLLGATLGLGCQSALPPHHTHVIQKCSSGLESARPTDFSSRECMVDGEFLAVGSEAAPLLEELLRVQPPARATVSEKVIGELLGQRPTCLLLRPRLLVRLGEDGCFEVTSDKQPQAGLKLTVKPTLAGDGSLRAAVTAEIPGQSAPSARCQQSLEVQPGAWHLLKGPSVAGQPACFLFLRFTRGTAQPGRPA